MPNGKWCSYHGILLGLHMEPNGATASNRSRNEIGGSLADQCTTTTATTTKVAMDTVAFIAVTDELSTIPSFLDTFEKLGDDFALHPLERGRVAPPSPVAPR